MNKLTLLTLVALLLAPVAVLMNFQSLENRGAMTFNDWN